jgi:hypothetical protein
MFFDCALGGVGFDTGITFVLFGPVVAGAHVLIDSTLAAEAADAGITLPGFVRSVSWAVIEMLIQRSHGIEVAVAIVTPGHVECFCCCF